MKLGVKIRIGVVVVMMLGFVVATMLNWKTSYPTYVWHQKLELVIGTPDGDKVGSSVVRARIAFRTAAFPGQISGFKGWSGEATVVDLGDGKYLFALVKEPVSLAQDTFQYLVPAVTRFKEGNGNRYPTKTLLPRFIEEIREKAPVVSEYEYPMLVTFDDINDPKTVRLVDPIDLAATFGKGYALKEMTLEITDEEVTIGNLKTILDYFWWEETRKEEYRCRTHGCSLTAMLIKLPNGGARPLTKSNFIRTR
ncbi:MAG: hypothetical protein OCD03_16350 [Hyphomicrobiales bacterium]